MLVALAFHSGDYDQAMRLLDWMQQLGGCPNHSCVLVIDAGVDWGDALEAVSLANKVFREASVITNDEPTEGWIPGSNSLFKAAAMHAQKVGECFLFLEPDVVPMRPQWLELIHAHYAESGFMGAIVFHSSPDLPNPYMEGFGVYPANAWSIMERLFNPAVSWTLACSEAVLPHATNSNLFQHFWGPRQDLPPTFASQRRPDSPENTLTLSDIRVETALYHRNKDGTLIRLLRQRRGIIEPKQIVVVFPICPADAHLAIRHGDWLMRLGRNEHQAIVAFDPTLPRPHLKSLMGRLQSCFRSVTTFRYPTPPILSWPQAPNWAFQHVARHMSALGQPWLWLEADSVVLQRDWLSMLQDSYERCGKLLMGPVVPNAGHINGVAVYPAELAELSPAAMSCTNLAFDHQMRPEMERHYYDAGHLLQHFWAIDGDRHNPNNGEAPQRLTAQQARQFINFNAALVHRIKDTSLVDLLLAGAL